MRTLAFSALILASVATADEHALTDRLLEKECVNAKAIASTTPPERRGALIGTLENALEPQILFTPQLLAPALGVVGSLDIKKNPNAQSLPDIPESAPRDWNKKTCALEIIISVPAAQDEALLPALTTLGIQEDLPESLRDEIDSALLALPTAIKPETKENIAKRLAKVDSPFARNVRFLFLRDTLEVTPAPSATPSSSPTPSPSSPPLPLSKKEVETALGLALSKAPLPERVAALSSLHSLSSPQITKVVSLLGATEKEIRDAAKKLLLKAGASAHQSIITAFDKAGETAKLEAAEILREGGALPTALTKKIRPLLLKKSSCAVQARYALLILAVAPEKRATLEKGLIECVLKENPLTPDIVSAARSILPLSSQAHASLFEILSKPELEQARVRVFLTLLTPGEALKIPSDWIFGALLDADEEERTRLYELIPSSIGERIPEELQTRIEKETGAAWCPGFKAYSRVISDANPFFISALVDKPFDECMKQLSTPALLASLHLILKNGVSPEKARALTVLGKIGGVEEESIIAPYTYPPETFAVRSSALQALGYLGVTATAPYVETAKVIYGSRLGEALSRSDSSSFMRTLRGFTLRR